MLMDKGSPEDTCHMWAHMHEVCDQVQGVGGRLQSKVELVRQLLQGVRAEGCTHIQPHQSAGYRQWFFQSHF